MKRRRFLQLGAATGFSAVLGSGCDWYPDQGLFNDCAVGPADDPAVNDLLAQTMAGLNGVRMIDGHVHLIGNGLENNGPWLNPNMRSLAHPVQKLQMRFYLNAACVADEPGAERAYIAGLVRMAGQMPEGMRLLLLAFDWHRDVNGQPLRERSTFFIPDAFARAAAERQPQRLAWAASIHPYREDAVDAVEQAALGGALAVKWLPPAQGMDPASPRCDAFYLAMARARLPLIVHAGDEHAVKADAYQAFGNPLKLRRALDFGVRVIVAHCATQGDGADLDRPASKARVPNFALFERLMAEADYQGQLFAELSAITQVNRYDPWLKRILAHEDWHGRMTNGSDYPLPGVMPLFSLRALVRAGFLNESKVAPLTTIRHYNPMLFDLALKRLLSLDGRKLPTSAFENAGVFGL